MIGEPDEITLKAYTERVRRNSSHNNKQTL